MQPKGQENRGGKRVGAGRKKTIKVYSEQNKKAWMRAARKLAKEMGMTVQEYMLRMIYRDDVQDTCKVAIIKEFNNATIIHETKQTVEKFEMGPWIGLPPTLEKPPEFEPKQEELQ